MELLDRLGLSAHAPDPAGFEQALPVTMPRGLVEMLSAAVALERSEGTDESAGRVELLLSHYLDRMPEMRTKVLADSGGPGGWFFQERLDWDRLPRLSAALEGAFALLEACGVPPEQALPAPSLDALQAAHPTLASLYAETFYGGCMPPLYGWPHDTASYAREAERLGDRMEVIDRRMAGPVTHELMHFRRDRAPLFPPYLDECLAGHLATRVRRGFAYPAPGDDSGIFGAPWLAQIGQVLTREVGLEAVVRAHAGVVPWSEVLPPGLEEACLELGWEQHVASRAPHFLAGSMNPAPWVDLITRAAGPPSEPGPEDREMLADALAAMCLRCAFDEGSNRVSTAAPPGPIRLDLEAGWCSRSALEDEEAMELVPPRYPLPRAWAATRPPAAPGLLEVVVLDTDALPDLVEAIWLGHGLGLPAAGEGHRLL